jgi:tRNA(Ile2) C34 agmatinyltransferase TiaS
MYVTPFLHTVVFQRLAKNIRRSERGRMKRNKLHTGQSLMENIVRLADYRKHRKPACPAPPGAQPSAGAQYFCTRCDADEFRLSPLGAVHCAHCGALMRNLLVSPSPSAAG